MITVGKARAPGFHLGVEVAGILEKRPSSVFRDRMSYYSLNTLKEVI